MDDDYNDSQDSMNEGNRNNGDENESGGDVPKEFQDSFGGYDDNYDDEDGSNNGRSGRGNRNNFRGRGRGPPPGWMNGPPPMRFRGRGYGPGGPPMRGRGFFRGRGGPRGFGPSSGPNFDGNWGPMGPPPPGMMGGPPPFGPPPGMMGPGGPMGPPPNMMGQPPPFGAPPGMPPPNMPGTEIWVETKSEDGKSYYYHARTRETTWTRPQESPTCKVITQSDMEAMAGQMPNMGGPQMGGPPMGGPQMGGPPMGGPQMGGPPMGGPPMGAPQMGGPQMGGPPMGGMNGPMGMGGPPMGMMPPGVAPPTSGAPPFLQPPPWANKPPGDDSDNIPSLFSKEALPPFMQPPPWANAGNIDGPNKANDNDQEMNSPKDKDDSPPGENPPPLNQAPNGFPGAPGGNNPPGWGGFGAGWPPPLSGQPPPLLAPPQQGNQLNIPPGQPPPLNIPTSQPMGIPTSQPMGIPTSQSMGIPTSQPMSIPTSQPMGMPPSQSLGPPPMSHNQPPMGLNQPPMGLNQPGMGLGQPPMGLGQPPMGLGMPPGQPLLGVPGIAMGGPEPAKSEDGKKDEVQVPPELAAAASEWSSHLAPDGRTYYYHARTRRSVWEKPQPILHLEEFQKKIASEQEEAKQENKPVQMEATEAPKAEVMELDATASVRAAQPAVEEKKPDDKSEKEDKDKSNSRPMWSVHIPGTPWRVVWTAEGRVFFFNPSVPKSVWARPPELQARDDVDNIIGDPPKAVLKLQQANTAAAAKTAAAAANGELKRTADSDSDDSEDEQPAKKTKVEEAPPTPAPVKKPQPPSIDAGKEAAIEAEVRAARERAVLPLDQRMKTFRQMLLENDVSAFSTWKKELHKIVFDKRYLLLTSDQRKQVFSKYVRERAEEERKEKLNRIQQRRNEFTALMEEAKLHSKSSFLEFSAKYGKDERFKAIDKPRNREQYFTEHLAELKRKEKEDRDKKREQVKNDFIAMLKEKSIDRHARWSDVKKKVDADPRYKAVESSTMKEDYFRDYCKIMKEEKRKEKDAKEKDKDRDRDHERSSSKKEKKDKERDKDRDKERDKDRDKKEKKSKREKGSDLDTSAEPEAEPEADADSDSSATREREARAQASIKEREREVQRALATSLRDRDKEREYHKRDEAVQHFNALLADLVRNPDLTWREAKKQLKKDHRYSLAELLSKDDKERLFTQHTQTLASKRRDKLRALLQDLGVPLTAAWRDTKKLLRDEPRAPVYASSEKMEREFRDYQRDRQSAAKSALRQLLAETRTLTHRTRAALPDTGSVHNELKHDARYLALEHIPEEREAIIMSYLEELEKKGPPPPPTATEPSRRTKL